MKLLLFWLTITVATVSTFSTNAQEQTYETNPAVIPAPRTPDDVLWPNWSTRHASFIERAKQGDVDLIFIGDSITQGWEVNGKEVWNKFYGNRKAIDIGINGDRTQHLLWRLDHGDIDHIKPKLAVLMIGTNNVTDGDAYSAEQIAEGIERIVLKLREKLPNTKILVLGIFPRDESPSSKREKIAETNEKIIKFADNHSIYYLNIGAKFLNQDGTLSKDIMPDFLHLSAKGYEIWAKAIEPEVSKLIKADQ